jgi:hypothetical protein
MWRGAEIGLIFMMNRWGMVRIDRDREVSMRRPSGSYRRFAAGDRARARCPLRLERLEDRLTLSQNAPSLAYEIPALGLAEPHVEMPVTGEMSVTGETYGEDYGAARAPTPQINARDGETLAGVPAAEILAGAAPSVGIPGGVGTAPYFAGDFRESRPQVQIVPNRPSAANVELVVIIEVGYGGIVQTSGVGFAIDATPDAIAYSSPAPIDSHVAHSHAADPSATAASGPHSSPSPPVIAVTADFMTRAPQATGDVVKANPAAAVPVLPPSAALNAFNVPGDSGPNRSQQGMPLIPQAGMGPLQLPSAHLPQAEPNLSSSAGAAALPGDEAERARANDVETSGASGVAAHKEILVPTSEGDRAALLANLQLNMEAVDQALEAMVGEIERLGVGLATWFDDVSLPSWGTAATVVAAFGVGSRCLLRGRARRSPQTDSEEESSSWLFTRLQSPAGPL